MDKFAHAGSAGSEAEVPTDMLASLLIEQASEARPSNRQAGLTPKVYAVMTVTSLFTFGTLVSAYQLLFSHQLFA